MELQVLGLKRTVPKCVKWETDNNIYQRYIFLKAKVCWQVNSQESCFLFGAFQPTSDLSQVVAWLGATWAVQERKANLLWEEWEAWILIFYQRTIGQVNTREAYYYNVIKENTSRLWYLYVFPATPIPTSRSSWHLFFRLSMHGPLRSTVTSLRWCRLW